MASKTDEARRTDRADAGTGTPKKGDRFRCRTCGMEIQVTADCRCSEPDHVRFHCCDADLDKV
ncbi:MAG TPA: hypothetical protein VGF55_02425 [Gemmataceae bacterium]|jgi:hypothetical protein